MEGAALGFGAALLLTTGEVVGGTAHWQLPALLVAGSLLLALGAVTTLPGALFAAGQSWGCYAGFVLGHAGQIVFTGRSAEAAAVLVSAAVLASLGGLLVRTVGRRAVGRRGDGWAVGDGGIPVQRTGSVG